MTTPIAQAVDGLITAFPPRPLDADHALGRTVTYRDHDKFKAEAQGKLWIDLPPAFWEFHHEALLYLDRSTIADYLPGYLAALFQDDAAIEMLPHFLLHRLTRDNPARFDAEWAKLTPIQRQAVRDALLALEPDAGKYWKDDVTAALDSYWRGLQDEAAAGPRVVVPGPVQHLRYPPRRGSWRTAMVQALDELVAAFPPHPLDARHAWGELGTTYLDYDAFERDAQGKLWTDLPPSFWEFHHDALSVLPPASIADYLPGYVATMIKQYPQLNGLPTFLLGTLTRDKPDVFDTRFAKLTGVQRQAIRNALLALESKFVGTPMQTDITAALDSYWRAFKAQGDQG